MKVENIEPTITDEEAYKRGFYYVLLTQSELDGPFLPQVNFLIGDGVIKFATPEDAGAHVNNKRYGYTFFAWRIAKVTVEEIKTVPNQKAIESARAYLAFMAKAQAEYKKLLAKGANQCPKEPTTAG